MSFTPAIITLICTLITLIMAIVGATWKLITTVVKYAWEVKGWYDQVNQKYEELLRRQIEHQTECAKENIERDKEIRSLRQEVEYLEGHRAIMPPRN